MTVQFIHLVCLQQKYRFKKEEKNRNLSQSHFSTALVERVSNVEYVNSEVIKIIQIIINIIFDETQNVSLKSLIDPTKKNFKTDEIYVTNFLRFDIHSN